MPEDGLFFIISSLFSSLGPGEPLIVADLSLSLALNAPWLKGHFTTQMRPHAVLTVSAGPGGLFTFFFTPACFQQTHSPAIVRLSAVPLCRSPGVQTLQKCSHETHERQFLPVLRINQPQQLFLWVWCRLWHAGVGCQANWNELLIDFSGINVVCRSLGVCFLLTGIHQSEEKPSWRQETG